ILPSDCRLKVQNRGPITLQGEPSSERITYTIKKRVRAKSEAEARALLRSASVNAAVRRGLATVALSETRSRISAEMMLRGGGDLQSVELGSSGGDIQVYDIAGSVQAETEGGLIQMDRIGSDVTARTGGGEIRFGRIDGSIRCFSGGGLIQVERAGKESWLETAGGDIFVRESGGPIHTSTAVGNIQVRRAASLVSARTAGGRIEVLRAHGIVLADNSGGSIQVGSSTGVRVASAGGSIRLRGSSGSLRAATDVGSILAELMQGAGLQDSILSTGAGDITVYIPSNLPLTVKASHESGPSGRIVSEFSEIPVREARAEGALNGGGPLLRLTSTGGTIYLKRQR
ncbi:MAG TPA: hypothetical protein VER03_09110, partial [Bryobacteraceae bacterium]|nr:hypothetical protein [Bryobacteraceae bacterium]